MQTPRAQRTSTDAQTWEFSHHKFLRGRPDLLDEIKRKALEPDPSVKHRVELPGDVHPFYVASQYHPEFKSRPERPAPLFREFVGAALEHGGARNHAGDVTAPRS